MTIEDNKKIAIRWYEAANKSMDLNQWDALVDEFVAPDYVDHILTSGDVIQGPDGVKQMMRQILSDNSDFQVTIESITAEADRVVVHTRITGHNALTGKPWSFHAVSISRMAGGKFAEDWEWYGLDEIKA
jgi:ketosteroid isomerase-like protein